MYNCVIYGLWIKLIVLIVLGFLTLLCLYKQKRNQYKHEEVNSKNQNSN